MADSEDDAEEDEEEVADVDGADAGRLNKAARVEYEEEEKEYCLYLLKGPQSIWAAVMSSCGDKQFLGVKVGEGGDA